MTKKEIKKLAEILYPLEYPNPEWTDIDMPLSDALALIKKEWPDLKTELEQLFIDMGEA